MKVPFHRHHINDEDIHAVVQALKGQFLTTAERNEEFERLFASYLGVPYTLTTNSCTSALHIALRMCGVERGDKVIVPALTFMATANAVVHAGGIPIFVDVDRKTGLMDLDALEHALKKYKPKVVMPVHMYGQMVDMHELDELRNRYGFRIVEDSAHSIEGMRKYIKPGQIGDFACFSFYATKNITCGEGGAITCKTKEDYLRIKLLRLHGMTVDAKARHVRFAHYDMEFPGYKYNLTNFQASMLITQLSRIEQLYERRKELALKYYQAFGEISFPELIKEEGTRSAFHLFGVLVEDRDAVAKSMFEKGIGVSAHYSKPVPLLAWYRRNFGYTEKDFPNAYYISQRILTLPLYPTLTYDEQEFVIETLKNLLV